MTAVEVVEGDNAPNKFIRVIDGDEELALIPWSDARLIYAAVKKEKEQGGDDA